MNVLSIATAEGAEECLLTTLCNHTKSVNVVRWSTDGNFLASGSDDHYILVYQRSQNNALAAQPFGSASIPNKVSVLQLPQVRYVMFIGELVSMHDFTRAQYGCFRHRLVAFASPCFGVD